MVDSTEQIEPEVLRVRAYGSSFFTLGINIRYNIYIFIYIERSYFSLAFLILY